jgi:serine/threonine-protein kinase
MTALTPAEIEAVNAAIHAIQRSRAFKDSERMCRFLRFAAEHALRQDPAPLKEYAIGVGVFDRGEDFDPRQDTIVRVEARRLRAKLKQYYESEGKDATVIVQFPERGYAPTFRFRKNGVPVRRRRQLYAAVAGIVLVTAVTGVVLWPRRNYQTPSIVVLPFINLSPDPSNEYIGDGFTEELTNALAGISELRVVARTSAFRFRGRAEDVRTIGNQLNVRWVLEGSVRKDTDQLRVTVQLIDTKSGMHVWSHAYDANMAGLSGVQQRIAAEVRGSLKLQLPSASGGQMRARLVKPEAHEAYLKGRYFWYQLTPEALHKSISSLNRAIDLEPTYAAAHAALADTYSLLPQLEVEPPGEYLDKCKSAAQRAVALDPDSAEAHFAAGVARAIADRDPAGAEREFLRALEMRPNLTEARQAYAVLCLSPLARHTQAIAEMRRVIEDDPVSPVARFALGQALAYAGRTAEALRELRESLELEPEFLPARQAIAIAYLSGSAWEEARLALQQRAGAADSDPYHIGLLGYTYGRIGNRAAAEQMLARLTGQRSYIPPLEVAAVYNGLGRTDEALGWLENAYRDRSPLLLWVAVDPRFASLRREARFAALTNRMGL